MNATAHDVAETLSSEIRALTGLNPARCYQCGKCSAGCPVRYYMDIAPNKIVRLIQLGFYEEALKSETPWLCAGCMTCSTRCPQEFDLAKFMDAVRELALEKGVKVNKNHIVKFHESFLNQIKRFGRSWDIGLIAEYKLKTLDLMQDVDSAPDMLIKGKLEMIPHKVKDKKSVKNIFSKTAKK